MSRSHTWKRALLRSVNTSTESTSPSRTASTAGTPAARSNCWPGTLTTSARERPESGATSITGAEKSNTTRVEAGDDQERRPVRKTPRAAAAAGPGPAASSSAAIRTARRSARVERDRALPGSP